MIQEYLFKYILQGAKQSSSGPKDVEKEKQQQDCPVTPSYVTLDSDDDELGKYSPCGSDDLQWLEGVYFFLKWEVKKQYFYIY